MDPFRDLDRVSLRSASPKSHSRERYASICGSGSVRTGTPTTHGPATRRRRSRTRSPNCASRSAALTRST
jgi:hypothetical protein